MNQNFKKLIQRNFNKASKTYDHHCLVQNMISDNSIKLLLNYKNNFYNIADFACGSGESTKRLADQINYNTCYAIDFSDKLLNLARNKVDSHIKFIMGDFEKPIFKDTCLDLIFCNMGLQWSFNLINTLSLFNDYLLKKGFFLFSLPIYPNFPEIKDAHKLIVHKHTEIIKYLKNSKFEIIECINQNYIETFKNSLEAIQSIKKIGANFSPYPANNIQSRNYIKDLITNPALSTLIYNIGIYLARKK